MAKKQKPKHTRNLSNYVKEVSEPVDPQTFVFISNVFHAAARMTMVSDNPSSKPILQDEDGKTYAFSDSPFNRGMLAARKELGEMSISPSAPYMNRLMHFGEVLVETTKFAEFFKTDDSGNGSIMVSEALIMACAVAKMDANENHMGFDLDDVLAHARRIQNEQDSADSATPPAH